MISPRKSGPSGKPSAETKRILKKLWGSDQYFDSNYMSSIPMWFDWTDLNAIVEEASRKDKK